MRLELLWIFAAFSMCCCASLSLLREGALRRTAAFVLGILIIGMWVEGLADLFPQLQWVTGEASTTALTSVSFAPSTSAEEVYTRQEGSRDP